MRKRSSAIGTFIAVGLGYLAGIMTAPKSGKETRKDIQKTAAKAKAEAEKKLKQVHTELGDLIDEGKKKAKSAKATTRKEFSEVLEKAQAAKQKAREILSAIHEGDAENADLQKAIKEATKTLEHLKKYIEKNEKTGKTK